MTDTIPNVPRELLADLLGNDHDKRIMAERHLLAMLANAPSPANHVEDVRAIVADPSPAGVDGLEVMSNWVLFDAGADKPYIKKMLPEGFLAFFDCEEDARRAKANNPGTDYKRIDRVKAEDAKAIIDGLRGEVGAQRVKTCAALKARNDAHEERDRQAQRIGELEGLLREVHGWIDESARVYRHNSTSVMLYRIDAALSAVCAAAPNIAPTSEHSSQPERDPCPMCIKGGICNTPTCGRLRAMPKAY